MIGHGYWGVGGAMVGAVGGLVAGWVLGTLPWLLVVGFMGRSLVHRRTEDLVADLCEHRTLTPNFVLRGLQRRDFDLSRLLPVVLDYLDSDQPMRRSIGFVALRSAYPEIANRLPDYSPTASPGECRAALAPVRAELAASPPTG